MINVDKEYIDYILYSICRYWDCLHTEHCFNCEKFKVYDENFEDFISRKSCLPFTFHNIFRSHGIIL